MAKFREIKQYTQTPYYQINVSWEEVESKLESIYNNRMGYKVELIPDFQRGHIWSEKKQIEYVEFKLRGGNGSNVLIWNCPGWMNSYIGPYQLVDGLQRITAVQRFMKNEIKACGYLYSEYEDRLLSNCEFVWTINNLKYRRDILQWYIELNSGGVVHTQKEIDRIKSLLEVELKL